MSEEQQPSTADLLNKIAEQQKTIDEQNLAINGYEEKSKDYETQITAQTAEINKLTKLLVENSVFSKQPSSEGVVETKTDKEIYAELLKDMAATKE